jgi:hypothetical protein
VQPLLGSVYTDLLPWAIAIALTPIAATAAIVFLGSKRGLAKSAALLAGDAGSMTLITVLCLGFAGGEGFATDGTPPTAILVGELLAGIALTGISAWAIVREVRARRSRREGAGQQALPAWLNAADEVGLLLALGIGIANMTLNVGNLFFTVSGAAAIANHGLSLGEEAAAVVFFVVVATSTVWFPIAARLLAPARSDVLLERMKAWIGRNAALVLAGIFLLVGLNLIAAATAALA